MALDVSNLIDQASARASSPKSSKKPVFLYHKEGHRALIRPLFNLDQAIDLPIHNKYSENRDFNVHAVCAAINSQPCLHCENAKTLGDKKLQASKVLYLPVYVYSVFDKAGQQVTYDETDDNDNKTTKPVKGFRVLELFLFGKTLAILQAFNTFVKIDESHDIRSCDFSLEQNGSGSTKNFVTMPRAPKPIDPAILKVCPPIDLFKTRIIENLSPLVATNSDPFAQSAKSQQASEVANDIPVF